MTIRKNTDVFSKEKRSEVMRAVKGKDTKPEIALRKALFALGYRYRLNVKGLPGKPDIVLAKHRTVIFVHGCFWHGHNCKRGRRKPKSNADYWRDKIARNKARDQKNATALKELGWRVVTVWECEIKTLDAATLLTANQSR
ncbi:very short patch repair endonuclease [Hyphococcus flavus]|uniref:Very short patch repair endonuclease n=1 Tax=Hyphococcus flavus TaxID=1866326 RepID=A0AAE9ZCY1_9PROT|nr:very short patch repair endonuclease [Hyphococcus flavus]WDI30318.1 very short patch repair endonuclease [Hyphococcus flavus]